MAVIVREIPVAFEGDGAGVGELTWGQLNIWRRTRQSGRTMNLTVTLPLAAGTPLAELLGLLRFLVGRHPALRTRLRFAPDPDGDRRPLQVVAGSGEIPLRLVEIGEDDDLAAIVDDVRSWYELEFFDYEHEFPVRMAVVTRSGSPAHLVIGYSHVMVDGAGIRALARDVDQHFDRAGGAAGAATAPPPAAPSALEVAQAQATPAGRRQSARAVRHWSAQLDRLTDQRSDPPTDQRSTAQSDPPADQRRDRLADQRPEPQPERLTDPLIYRQPDRQADRQPRRQADPQIYRPPDLQAAGEPQEQEPRHWELVGYSPAMELAMRAVAARTGTGTTHVLLAAYAVAVNRVFGRDPSVAQIVVGNRFRPGFADLVSQVSQHGICVVDVADAGFDEVVARAEKAVTGACFAGYYDPVACDALLTETAARHGRAPDIEWHLNDRREKSGAGEGDGLVPSALDVTQVLPLSRWYWDRKVPVFDGALFIQVDSEPLVPERRLPENTPPAAHLEIWTDTRSFALDRIEAFAREMEAVVVAAALGRRKVPAHG